MDSKLKDQLNFYNEFKYWYFQIKNDFKFKFEKDRRGRDYLSQILMKKNQNWKLDSVLRLLKETLSSKSGLLIYGCGPSLEKTIDILFKKKGVIFFRDFINITADGASVLLREKGIPVDAIFTDLDGITSNDFNYAKFIIIHAHGDNIEKLKTFKDDIIKFENVIGTTQIEPVQNLLNPGGFTDGDRIFYFLRTLLSPFHKLFLIGMDFGTVIGKYSKLDLKSDKEASPIKLKKLQYAIKLIKWLSEKIENPIYLVNSNFKNNDFLNLSIEDFLNFYKI